MSENVNDRKVFSLFEVMNSIRKTLAERYKSSYWIKAEMSKLNLYSHSGHCYPELIEKQEGKVIAQLKANLWKDDYRNINNNFLKLLKEPLKDGIKILFLAKISFDPIHGLTLRITDIDPAYTLGDLEREKQDTIKRMKEEGIFDKNKALQIALLPKRIAIISVETSKGYADFLEVLQTNTWGYTFFTFLFPSLLQGDKAIDSIISQLKQIKKVKSHFDVVAIIRGGGGDVGLSCYNTYTLAKEIALFPMPVITGIGHATNETVVEMISFSNAITPTKIAGYLLQKFHDFSVPVQRGKEKIMDKSRRLIGDERSKFISSVKLFRSVTENILIENKSKIKAQITSLVQQSVFLFKNERDNLQYMKDEIKRGSFLYCGTGKQEIRQMVLDMKKDVISQFGQVRLIVTQHTRLIVNGSAVMITSTKHSISREEQRLSDKTFQYLKSRDTELKIAEKDINNMSPDIVLKRGYSITYKNGKVIKNIEDVKPGDTIDSVIFGGSIESTVISSQNLKE